jgi:hypothetical protein
MGPQLEDGEDVANSRFPGLDFPQATIPIRVASANEIEKLVCLTDITPSQLAQRAQDPERITWANNEPFAGATARPNPILKEGWVSYPWGQSR